MVHRLKPHFNVSWQSGRFTVSFPPPFDMGARNPVSSSSLGQPLRGKTCLVTGASSGIGKATARELAGRGARVIMVCRDRDRGERALLELQLALGAGNLYLLAP
jgi:NADPH:quinone reductase-like Zn-dependent oxidoreductase